MLRVVALAACLPLLAIASAAAQTPGSSGIAGKGFSPIQGVGPKPTEREAPPPGLPGSTPRATAAPLEGPLDVPPTEALFEAINRGDIATARDALNRGADIYGRNVLGMTPLDLSVDLSRNDITFLLLSMRSQASVSGPENAQPGNGIPPGGAGRGGKKVLAAGKSKSRPKVGPVPMQAAITSPAKPPSVRYASVPSAPVPQAGFLGFGAGASP